MIQVNKVNRVSKVYKDLKVNKESKVFKDHKVNKDLREKLDLKDL